MTAVTNLSPAATAYFNELWERLWHGESGDRVGEVRAELRAKYGEAVEREVAEWFHLGVGVRLGAKGRS